MSTLYGCGRLGALYKIDTSSGAGVLVGNSGFVLNSLAANKSGVVYSVADAAGVPLIRINPNTGAGTFVANLNPGTQIFDLSFAPNNTLFAITYVQPGTGPQSLVTINVNTGAVTVIAPIAHPIFGIAFAPNGTLYGWDGQQGLVTINTSTAALTAVNPTPSPPAVDIQGLSFDSAGKLYGGRNALFKIDVTNGAVTQVGSGGYPDLRGFAFASTALIVPYWIVYVAWLWLIWVGYILITPIGPICVVCGDPLSGVAIRILGAITILLGGLGFWAWRQGSLARGV